MIFLYKCVDCFAVYVVLEINNTTVLTLSKTFNFYSEVYLMSKKTALITGASSGFGRLTALAMLAEGHTVYATMRNVNTNNSEVVSELEGAGAVVLELDVTDNLSVKAAIEEVSKSETALDVLVNNAGVAAAGISESFHIDQVQSMFDVNVFGLMRVSQAVLPLMRQQKDGLIINIGSILGRVTFPFFGLYGASKYAVEAITDSMSYELSQLGVDVVLIQPSAYPTNMYANAIIPELTDVVGEYGDIAQIPEAISSTIASMFEGDDAPQPADIANAVVAIVAQEKGQREKRTVVGVGFGADAANAEIKPIQSGLIASLDLSLLEQVKV